MVPSTFFTLVSVLSSLVAANGAVIPRDGTFTFLTPQPTAPSSTTSTSRSSSTATTTTTSSVFTLPTTTCQTMSGGPPPMTRSAPGNAVSCNGIQQWQADFAYSAGDQVIFNGQLFTARQWTYNNAPSSHPDQWTAGGTCNQPINNQANCNGVSAWSSTVAYTTGNKVTFTGHLWSAVQWTESNTPGDTSGSWQDLGACA